MTAKSVIRVIAAAMLLAACSAEPPQYFGPNAAWLPFIIESTPTNSPEFAKRPALPGQAGYLETIKYIDDGVKHIDPYAEFFVSYDGQICFRGLVNHQLTEFENYQNYWCMYPVAVNNVDAIEDDISYVNTVRLWCAHSSPQCARRFGYPNFLDESGWIDNSITVQIRPFGEERRAIEYLVYLMGGNAHDTGPPVPLVSSAAPR
jgi:hypothetical protein